MSRIKKIFHITAIICLILQSIPAQALNPLFDTERFQASPTSKHPKKRARFFFREAHHLDVTAVKSLALKGDKTGAMKILTRAKSLYRVAQKIDPTNVMITIYYKAHDSLSDAGLLIKGDPEAKLALSSYYDGDGEDNETPKDPDLRAFWLGEGLIADPDEDEAAETTRTVTLLPQSSAEKKEDDDDKKKESVVDKRMAALFLLAGLAGTAGLETGKSLTTEVGYHYLGGGIGCVVGFIAYVIILKTMMCMSSNYEASKKSKDTEVLLNRLEEMLDQRSFASPQHNASCISCPTVSCPSCSDCLSSLLCCCFPCRRMRSVDDAYVDQMDDGVCASPLYQDRSATMTSYWQDDGGLTAYRIAPPDHDAEAGFRDRYTRPTLNNLRDKTPERLKELTQIFQQRLVKYGPDDEYVVEFLKKTKDIRKDAEQSLIIRYSPENSQHDSADDESEHEVAMRPYDPDAELHWLREQARQGVEQDDPDNNLDDELSESTQRKIAGKLEKLSRKERRAHKRKKRHARTHDDSNATETAMATAKASPAASDDESVEANEDKT